jgi:hypothetical protein
VREGGRLADGLHEQQQHECDDEKIDNRRQERAVIERDSFF